MNTNQRLIFSSISLPKSSSSSSMNHRNMFRFKKYLLLFLAVLAQTAGSAHQKFAACKHKHCGDGLEISYPFWIQGHHARYCGHPLYGINCVEEKPVIRISNGDYVIRKLSSAEQTVLLVDKEILDEDCPTPQHNISLVDTRFQLGPNNIDLYIFYNCTSVPSDHYTYSVACSKTTNTGRPSFATILHESGPQYLNSSTLNCQSMVNAAVAVGEWETYENMGKMSYVDILREGFFLNWTLASNCAECEESGGHCGFEQNKFVCFCPDYSHSRNCKRGQFFPIY